jgi:signal transduction histidine kinase
LLKLIGEELISDEVVAVSELVKNAHDADALSVTLSFRQVTGPEGIIEVRDDGCGMNLDTLLGRWMEPAASTKVGVHHRLTVRGRRVLGEKGVGRFAADKLARHLKVISRPSGSADEVCAEIDWDQYDDGELMLDGIKNQWELRAAREIAAHGTIVRMAGLRSVWTERMFRRLSIRLGRLLSPFGDRDRFSVRIESDEFPAYSGELRSDILDRSPYRIEARFDGKETITMRTGAARSTSLRWNGQGELDCGPVLIRLFAFDLEGEALARIGPRMEVRAWLKEWTGVSIYRDGFRIWPYGEPSDDWLRLDQRRVNNPVEHLSNNQVIGFIDIGRDASPGLMDQTNREGLMNNRAFDDLRRLVYFVLQILECDRRSLRHPVKREPASSNGHLNGSRSFGGELERLAARADASLAEELRNLGKKLDEHFEREQTAHDRLIEGYADLAAVGQMTAFFVAELSRDLEQLTDQMKARAKDRPEELGGHTEGQERASQLAAFSSRMQLLRLAASSEERRRAIDVEAELKSFLELARPALSARGVKIKVDITDGEVIRTSMRPEHFHCLLQVLTANAIEWMRDEDLRRFRISVTCQDDNCHILFSDTGPGIPYELSERVFEPRFSMREGGRGMGLTIARRLTDSHGGQIEVIQDGRRRGANLRITLPRKRSRARFHAAD